MTIMRNFESKMAVVRVTYSQKCLPGPNVYRLSHIQWNYICVDFKKGSKVLLIHPVYKKYISENWLAYILQQIVEKNRKEIVE